MKNKLKFLCTAAIMLSLATVLSLVKIYRLPLGGAVTLCSMLPVVYVAMEYPLKASLFCSFAYSLVQLLLGIAADGLFAWGLTPAVLVGCIFFDYIFAYTVLGLSGIFSKHGTAGKIGGIALSFALRFASHFVSGIIFFKCFDVFNSPVIWSLVYNGSYMLPELVLTLFVYILLLKAKAFSALKK